MPLKSPEKLEGEMRSLLAGYAMALALYAGTKRMVESAESAGNLVWIVRNGDSEDCGVLMNTLHNVESL